MQDGRRQKEYSGDTHKWELDRHSVMKHHRFDCAKQNNRLKSLFESEMVRLLILFGSAVLSVCSSVPFPQQGAQFLC